MNGLQIFTYEDTPIRTVEREDGIWWVLKDVCNVLQISNTADVAARLDDDEKGIATIDTLGGKQEMLIINEPGLYNAIFRSAKPEAKDFKRWVTHEVLPSIRRTGSYSMTQSQPMTPAQLLAAQAQVLVDMERRMDEMQGQTRTLEAKVDTAMKAFSRPAQDHWTADTDRAIKELCETRRLSVTATKGRMYAELERTAGCSVTARLNRLRERKKKAGMRHRDAMALTKLDAISADKQLRAIFEGVVRSWQAQPLPVLQLKDAP
ncbi:MAG: hypothetical protein K2L38_11230 [Dysosmobacter sp.]|nr:hypothetical protein [Dysosmobacter sp.]